MRTITLYSGRPESRVALGDRQCRITEFAEGARCWHWTAKPADARAVKELGDAGILDVRKDPDVPGVSYRFIP